MIKKIATIFISLLLPGFGYLQKGYSNLFYKTILFFFFIIFCGAAARLFTNFPGLAVVISALFLLQVFTAIHASTFTLPAVKKIRNSLKYALTLGFLLITCFSFAGRRRLMGFDILSMAVPVMEPAVMQGDKFLTDTWIYKNNKPAREDVVVHAFKEQQGLYVNRIIAIENDSIEIQKGIVYLNKKPLPEPYVSVINVAQTKSRNMALTIVGKGQYFVMGDNRDASFGDSRFNGCITIADITGMVTDIWHTANMK